MNILNPDSRGNNLIVILRSNAGTSALNYVIEFISAGGEVNYIYPDVTIPSDPDLPYNFLIGDSFEDREQFNISIYYFPNGYTDPIVAALDDLKLSPQADAKVSLKQAMDSLSPKPTFELVYRGMVYCTSETTYYPYAPVRDDFEVIEKDATIYKTRQ